ncbi:MAG: hypothetical protein QOF82_1904 [Frankiales bacterium]|nr:hypothetical protein [Frankiales bacterium]MDX6210045.1 hypothetical protein [Frankiales bacterium]MDX6212817.1 hypothetical protein [Frankiales bacterium]MDX6221052.1 hypothetical protein [Frankiales bacterium]
MTYAGPVHLILAGRVLADDSNGPGAGLGLVVFLVLLVGCIFLFRSMSGRIKRLPASFGPPPPASPEAQPQPPDEDPKPQ